MTKVIVDQIPGVLVHYEDGSTDRVPLGGIRIPANAEFHDGFACKDVVINSDTGLWARIFLPQSVAGSSNRSKLPIVLHFHGGGMCLGDPADLPFHDYCRRMVLRTQYIWVSVGYRLSPEHRLPTQFDDGFEAFRWLRAQFRHEDAPKEPWIVEHGIVEHGDSSNVFLTGESAGATISHRVAIRIANKDWSPVTVRGVVFVDVGNLRLPLPVMKPTTNSSLTPEMLQAFIKLSLPHGAKPDDPIMCCIHPSLPSLSENRFPPTLVTLADRDLLYETGTDYVESLKEAGNDVEVLVSEGEGHCFHMINPASEAAQFRENKIAEFMLKRAHKAG